MERYTIRILYRDAGKTGKFVGVVEADGIAGKRGFVNKRGLLHILTEMVGAEGGENDDSVEYRRSNRDENREGIPQCL